MAQLIKTTGEILEISPKNGINFQLDELQKYVDGYIEIVNLNNGEILVVNEDGKFVEEMNEKATQIKHDQERIIEQQAPKASYADTVLLSSSTYTTTQIAKDLGMTGRMLNSQLKAMGVQYFQSGQWLLYKRHQDKGYTKTHTYHYSKNNGNVGTSIQTVWTEKGRMFIYSLIKGDNEYLTELGKELNE